MKCLWCGVSFSNLQEFEDHTNIHRQLDILNGNCTPSINEVNIFDDLFDRPSSDNEPMEDSRGPHSPAGSGNEMDVFDHSDTRDGHQEPMDDLANPQPGPSGYQRKGYHCHQCSKSYALKSSLNRHVRSTHLQQRYACTKCGKEFKNVCHKTRHEKTCDNAIAHYDCEVCGKRCVTAGGLRRHRSVHEKQRESKKDTPKAPKPSSSNFPAGKSVRRSPESFRCRQCSQVFPNRRDLYEHGMQTHYQRGGRLQDRPWDDEAAAPWRRDEGLRRVYEINEPLILEQHQPGPVVSTFNFPVDNTLTLNDLETMTQRVYDNQEHAFKINLIFGLILQNRETGEFRYFRPYNNVSVLEAPLYVSRRQDLYRLRLRLRRMDLMTQLLRQRPDTKWIPVLLTNVRFLVYHTHYPLGNGSLPEYLKHNKAIQPLDIDRQTGKPYEDNLCAFRCLALHNGYDVKCLERATQDYFRRWGKPQPFQGISFEDFPAFEDKFGVNLEVYRLDEDGRAWSVYRSRGRHERSMYLNLHESHLSYVNDFQMYAKKFQCRNCDRHFTRSTDLHRHEKTCDNKTKYVFPGGFFKPSQTIFDQLSDYGIIAADRTYPWFIVFDFEAMLTQAEERNSDKLQWTQKHVPISVSVCSNVPDFEKPVCFIDDDLDKLVESMVAYMEEIAVDANDLAEFKWKDVTDQLQQLLDQSGNAAVECHVDDEADDYEDDEDVDEKDDSSDPQRKSLLKLLGRFKGYMSQVPVLGFNSAKYDLNLIKSVLARHLNMHQEKHCFVVKKNNEYSCISSPTLKFLDIMQFLAPGTSYAKFLKAYGIQEQKGFFPYEWFTSMEKLDHPSLPPHQAFYSSLKDANISQEQYQFCVNVWEENGMSTFRDFLEWYNNLDVGPFVKAVEKFQEFYFDKGINVLKTAISVPGIARQLLFKTARDAGANFALFDKFNEDLYHTFKNNIVGGPSIIFTRHHRVGSTYIRNDKAKPCKKIVGFDANALYLWAIDQPMPVGPFVRRKADNDFPPEVRDRFMAAYHWMDWLNHTNQAAIQHKLNNGQEKRVGNYPVDGWDANTNTIYQFHRCYFHGHECEGTRNVKDPKWKESRETKFKKTLETTRYLKSQGHNVVEMWECQFRRYCRENRQIYEMIDASRPGYFQSCKGKVTQEHVVRGVRNGSLFGALEVDICVPEVWSDEFRGKTPLSPWEYFGEMSPLFCTTEVNFEDIGSHMQQHVEEFGLSKNPRRLLVGGMKAEKLLIASPLLKWYLDHGMKVTKVHQVVEYLDKACFQAFVKEVSDARRNGDARPETAIIADTSKVIGNSGYGSLIMDKTKHRDVKYVQGEKETCLQVNDPRFRKLECLEEKQQYYEIEMAKKKIKLDLPIQLGYFILQYAKLRMLSFYYDFLDVYVDRTDFEYCEMDTDSAYMAISQSSFDDVIKPSMRCKYQRGLTGFCNDGEVKADSDFHWFPRTCCTKHAKYDKRTPGLFKTEYEGDEMIGLCSKTYIVRKSMTIKPTSTSIVARQLLRKAMRLKRKRLKRAPRRTNEYKFSCKGINKRALSCPMTTFRHVLKTSKPSSGINKGFRAKNNTIFTYVQERRGFSYFYCKRKVLPDGIHTEPLDVVLCPAKDEDQELIRILQELMEESDSI